MIKQNNLGLDSRSEAFPYKENNMLPLITAPMYSVVDDNNYQTFLNNKINVCLPRGKMSKGDKIENGLFHSCSLNKFISAYINDTAPLTNIERICIDVANGNMPLLHKSIRKAKSLHGNKLVVMAGNVSTLDAFAELAANGCDYIRIGIGGSSACNTTTQTGVGQEDLEKLISKCHTYRKEPTMNVGDAYVNIKKVKIVADGITTYMNQLIDKKQALDNGYAAINRLLYAGADLVMVGKLFAQSHESAGEKAHMKSTEHKTYVNYYGMSTKKAQEQYKPDTIKPSEGNSQWIPVKWTLDEWLNGKEGDDYLIGYVNALKSAMSYTGSKTLNQFNNN